MSTKHKYHKYAIVHKSSPNYELTYQEDWN